MKKTSLLHFVTLFISTFILCSLTIFAEASTLTLPNNLTAIEEEAFYGDTGLDDVVLPEGILSIGDKAFQGSSLRKVNLPSSLTHISNNAFPSPEQVTVTAQEGTYAYKWAVANGYISAVSVSPTEQRQVLPTEGTYAVTITSTGKWTATSEVDWLKINEKESVSGEGNETLSVTVAANYSRSSRTGNIVITCGREKATYTVEQKDGIIVTAGGGPRFATLSIETNYSWTATTEADWLLLGLEEGTCEVKTVSAAGDSKVYVQQDYLPADLSARTGTVVIEYTVPDCGICSYTYTFSQKNTDVPMKGVKLPETLCMAAGTTETLLPVFEPDYATDRRVVWTSSNTDVATIDANGEIVANSHGNTIITVKTTDGSYTASCGLTVVRNTLDTHAMSLVAGQTGQLQSTIRPARYGDKLNGVKWYSMDESIATVDFKTGKVTAIKEGSTTIYSRTNYGDALDHCKVTVTATDVFATGITIDKSTAELHFGTLDDKPVGDSIWLTAAAEPSDTTQSVEWITSDASIVSIASSQFTAIVNPNINIILGADNDYVLSEIDTSNLNKVTGNKCYLTAKAKGTATITAKINGKTAKCVVTVTDCPLSAPAEQKDVPAKGAAYTIRVEASCTWKAYPESGCDWLSVNVDGAQTGTKDIKVTAAANPNPSARAANIIIQSAVKKITYRVHQQAGVPATGIIFDSSDPTVVVVGKTITLTPVLTPANTTQTVSWSIASGSDYASVSSAGVVTGKASGTATIQAKINGKTATRTVTVVPPVTITKHPSNCCVTSTELQQYIVGSSNKISFSVTGTGIQSYQWQQANSAGEWSDISGATQSTYAPKLTATDLTVFKSSGATRYTYRCKLTGVDGTVVYTNRARCYGITLSKASETGGNANGGGTSLTVTHFEGSNASWTATTAASWIKLSVDGGKTKASTVSSSSKTTTVYVYYEKNNTDAARTGSVIVKYGAATETYKLTQNAGIIPVTEISSIKNGTTDVTGNTIPLEKGTTTTLTAIVAPSNATNKTVTWTSSNPAVASIDKSTGKITVLSSGSTTITATSADGGKTKTCVVKATSTVSSAPTIKNISSSNDSISINWSEVKNAVSYTLTVTKSDNSWKKTYKGITASSWSADWFGNGTYSIIVTAVGDSSVSNNQKASTSKSVTVKANQIQTGPTPSVSVNGTNATLNWTEVDKNATWYEIELWTSASYASMKNGNGGTYLKKVGGYSFDPPILHHATSHTFTGLSSGVYYVWVAGVNAGGNYKFGNMVPFVIGTATNNKITSKPVVQAATASGNTITVKWTMVQNAVNYRVCLYTDSGYASDQIYSGFDKRVGINNETTFTGVPDGAYYVAVAAEASFSDPDGSQGGWKFSEGKRVRVGNAGGVVGDDYPAKYRNETYNSIVDEWAFYNRQCTSFVAWCLNSRNHIPFSNYYNSPDERWGNAGEWGDMARRLGYTIDQVPKIGSVFWDNSGTFGHVAWVAVVNWSNYTVTIEEYNYSERGCYGTRIISIDSGWYIHIADIE